MAGGGQGRALARPLGARPQGATDMTAHWGPELTQPHGAYARQKPLFSWPWASRRRGSIDMSPAFIAGVIENLTEAEIPIDRFHVMKLIGDAVDKVRRGEVKVRPELKGTRYVWTKNQPKLTAKQADTLAAVSTTKLKTARVWRMHIAFQDIYQQPLS